MAGGTGKKQNDIQAIVNILLTAVGLGMLSLSGAIAKAGFVCGFLMFFGFGFLAIYLCLLLDRSMRLAAAEKREILRYEDIGSAAFGKIGWVMASVPLHLSLIGCSCALITLLAEHSRGLIGWDAKTEWWRSREAFCVAWGLLMLPVTWLKTMKHVGVVSSTVGVGAVFVMLISIIIEGFKTFLTKHRSEDIPNYPRWPENLISLGNPFAAFTVAFAVTCTVPTIIRDLEKRDSSAKVLTWGVMLTMVVYLLPTVAGFLAWGEGVDGSIMNSMESSSFFTNLAKAALILACACHYAVMLHPSCREFEDMFNAHEKTITRSLLRSVLVAVTILTAVLVAELRMYISILGSVTFAAIHSFLPPLFYMRLSALRGKTLPLWKQTGLSLIMGSTVVGGYFGLMDALGLSS